MTSNVYTDVTPEEDESHQAISSYFLGPRAENYEYFKQNIIEILEGQRDTRLDYFPQDGKFVTAAVQASSVFRNSTRKVANAVRQAARLLSKNSIPFWSPRYQGHICMDLSMPALLGYFLITIYNPKYVSIEASPFTTVAEITAGDDLCRMFGYNVDPDNKELLLAWGHIVCGGTVANLESVWVTRNLKFYSLSIRSAMKKDDPLSFIAATFEIEICLGVTKLLKDLTNWELLNLKPKAILDIREKIKGTLEQEFGVGPMKYFVSNTRHYSWPKAAAVTGLGSDSMVDIKVDHGACVDLDDLRSHLQSCLENQVAVYSVVAIIGSTEEGAVDPLRDIIKLRDEFQAKGLSFLVHGDAAWGGFLCTLQSQNYQAGQEIKLPSEKGSGSGFIPDSSL